MSKAIRPLKAQGDPLEEWITAAADIGSTDYDANIVRQTIAKGLKSQSERCFHCGKSGHLRKDCYIVLL